MPVLERASEEDVETGRSLLELVPVVAEADDHRTRVQPTQRLQQNLYALVLDQLAVVDDRGPVAGEELREAQRVALVRQPFVRVSRVRRIEPRLCEEPRQRVRPRRGAPEIHVDTGRDLMDALDRAADLADDVPNVLRAHDRRRCVPEDVAAPR